MPDINKVVKILNSSEVILTKNLRDFIKDAQHFVDTAKFQKILPNTSLSTYYQSSISTEVVAGDIVFNIMNIITITPDKKLEFKYRGSIFEDLSFSMRHFSDNLTGEKVSEKDTTYSFKFSYPPVKFNGTITQPYILVKIKVKNNSLNNLELVYVYPYPLSAFYNKEEHKIKDILLFNTINDVIVEDISDHITNKSTNSSNFEKDTHQFFSILKSWVNQDYPVNTKYNELA